MKPREPKIQAVWLIDMDGNLSLIISKGERSVAITKDNVVVNFDNVIDYIAFVTGDDLGREYPNALDIPVFILNNKDAIEDSGIATAAELCEYFEVGSDFIKLITGKDFVVRGAYLGHNYRYKVGEKLIVQSVGTGTSRMRVWRDGKSDYLYINEHGGVYYRSRKIADMGGSVKVPAKEPCVWEEMAREAIIEFHAGEYVSCNILGSLATKVKEEDSRD